MGVIHDFVREYERQFDYWEASARAARDVLEAELSSSGLRAIVTSRAKSVDRLTEKLVQRNRERTYRSIAQISKDIVDLAGVRVALYFPGQTDEVEQVIRDRLDVKHYKRFPSPPRVESTDPDRSSKQTPASRDRRGRQQRFSGYGARHFRVLIPESRLSTGQERYATAPIEVQVASVLMHAWSEVEHDLVYKPLEGKLSPSEYAILDQLNGLVLAGEIALEELQQAADMRVTVAETPFRDHFELAEFLRSRLSALGDELTDATLGQIDVLFGYLAEQDFATAAAIKPYLDLLERDFERRPVAAQLADLMLSGDEERYRAFLRAASASRHPSMRLHGSSADETPKTAYTLALGEFVAAWVLIEALFEQLFEPGTRPRSFPAVARQAREQQLITPEQYAELGVMRDLRNGVLHGKTGSVPPQRLVEGAKWLRALSAEVRRKAHGQ